jgi:hypothetical protein
MMHSMRVWRVLTTVLFLAISACSFPEPADVDDDTTTGDDGGGDDVDGDVDGAVPAVRRVFIATACCAEPSAMYLATVDEGVPGAAMPMTPLGKVRGVAVSSAGDSVIYSDDSVTPDVFQLQRIRIDDSGASAPQVVSVDHGGGDTIFGTWVASDGSHLVYGWGRIVKGPALVIDQYYFVDLSGAEPGTPVALTGGALPTGGLMSRDGRKFAYVENHGVYVVDVSGTTPSAPITISAPNAQAEISYVQFSPSADKLSFVADLTTNGVYELYVVDVSGSTPGAVERASGPLASGEDVMSPDPIYSLGTPPAFTPDGTKLAYLVTDGTGVTKALYVVDVSGSAPGTAHRVNDVPVSGGAFEVGFFAGPTFIITDNAHVLYRIDQRFDDVYELFRVDISGALPGPSQRISGALVTGGDVGSVVPAPDGSGAIYAADQRTDGVSELFYVDLRGSQPAAPVLVNGPLVAGGNAGIAGFAPDSRTIVYTADVETDEAYDHYVVGVSAGIPAAPQKVTTESLGASYFPPTIAPDGSAIYWLDGYGTGMSNLWTATLDGAAPGPPMRFDVTGVTVFWLR